GPNALSIDEPVPAATEARAGRMLRTKNLPGKPPSQRKRELRRKEVAPCSRRFFPRRSVHSAGRVHFQLAVSASRTMPAGATRLASSRDWHEFLVRSDRSP